MSSPAEMPVVKRQEPAGTLIRHGLLTCRGIGGGQDIVVARASGLTQTLRSGSDSGEVIHLALIHLDLFENGPI